MRREPGDKPRNFLPNQETVPDARVVVVQKDHEDTIVFAGELTCLIGQREDVAPGRGIVVPVTGLDEPEGLNRLGLPRFADLEVLRRQIDHRPALPIGDDDVDADRIDPASKHGRRNLRCRRLLGHRMSGEAQRPDDET